MTPEERQQADHLLRELENVRRALVVAEFHAQEAGLTITAGQLDDLRRQTRNIQKRTEVGLEFV